MDLGQNREICVQVSEFSLSALTKILLLQLTGKFIHFDISSAEVICTMMDITEWLSSLIHDFSFRVQGWNVPLSFPFSFIKIKEWEVGEYELSYYLDLSSNFIPLLFSVHRST